MKSFIYNDKKLELYLRNELPDEEIAALEDELLRDDEFFQRLQTVEMNLIDRYLENEMTGEEKEHFKANYLSNPTNQWKVEEARVFRKGLELVRKKESSTRNVTNPPLIKKGVFYSVRLPQFAAAAVILISIAVFVAWLVIRSRSQNSNSLSTKAVRPPTLETGNKGSDTPPLREQPSPSPNIISSPERKREPLQEQWLYLKDEATGVMGPGDDLHLTILPDTKNLSLRFELLDDARTKDVFRITIKDEMGYPVFPSGTIDVKPSSIRYRGLLRRAISINLPVTLLKPGERYRFEIADPYAQKTFVINKTARR